MISGLRTYSVDAKARAPLLRFMTDALTAAGCRLIHRPSADTAPFVMTFETPTGERMGIIAYAFLATRTPTRNRPVDERSFQIKYGSKQAYAADNSHELWQDPLGMFTTLLVGIDPERGICISADPIVHSPTKFFIRVEFKDEHAEAVADKGWHAWERAKLKTPAYGLRVETVVGVTQKRFLDLVRFERAARGLDPGNRLILAEGHAQIFPAASLEYLERESSLLLANENHLLVNKFELSPREILDVIAEGKRLEMAVRGGVAEEHLRRALTQIPGVTDCERLVGEGGPDLRLRYQGGPPLTLECKNVSRDLDRLNNPRLDFQRTRAAKSDPCSRYYKPSDFDLVAACLHAVSQKWTFRYTLSASLPTHKTCLGRINSNVRVDGSWVADAEEVFRRAYSDKNRPR